MHKITSVVFGSIFRIFFLALLLISFHLLAPQTYAYQPIVGAWTQVGLPDRYIASMAVDPTNPSIVYAGTDIGLYKSTDGGDNWSPINTGLPTTFYIPYGLVINPQNTNVLYAALYGAGVFKSIDGGANWTDITDGTSEFSKYYLAMVLDPNNPDTVYVGLYGNCSSMYETTDGGANWTHRGIGCDIYSMAIDPTTSYVYGGGSSVVKSIDGGENWTGSNVLSPGGGVGPIAIDPNDPNTVYAKAGGGSQDGLFKSTDGATTFTKVTSYPGGPGGNQNMVTDPLRPNTVYVGSRDTSTVYQTPDGGTSWVQLSGLSTSGGILKLLMPANNPTILYAGTQAGIYAYGFNSTTPTPTPTATPTPTPVPNQPPVINPISNTTINEGSTYATNGSFTDPDSSSWTATVDYGDGSGIHSLTLSGTNFSLSHVYKDNGVYTVTVTVADDQGATGQTSATVSVNNVVPTVGTITAPASPVQVSTAISASALFTDAGVLDTHTASWNWGDGNSTTGSLTEANGSGSVSGSHIYTATGVYTITLTVTDKDGGQGISTYQYVAVYDSSTSFAGGRSFINPSGSSASGNGKVTFGISSKYSNSNVLTGSVKMDFKDAGIDFASTSLQSLATSTGKAYLKGAGAINGSGTYTFLISGVDGSVTGGSDLIRFQLKDSSGTVIYDSQPSAGDTADPTTQVATGNIRIH